MKVNRYNVLFIFLLSSLLFAGCVNNAVKSPAPSADAPASPVPIPSAEIDPGFATGEVEMFVLSSSAFSDGGVIGEKYTYKMGRQCSGENYSPPLEWKGTPPGTQSLLLTMIDPDGGNWVHWILANIPADTTSLPEKIGGPLVGVPGRNDFGETGYGGPCPPSGTHRYVFTLYALDTTLDVKSGVTLKTLIPYYKDHILGKSVLTGLKKAK